MRWRYQVRLKASQVHVFFYSQQHERKKWVSLKIISMRTLFFLSFSSSHSYFIFSSVRLPHFPALLNHSLILVSLCSHSRIKWKMFCVNVTVLGLCMRCDSNRRECIFHKFFFSSPSRYAFSRRNQLTTSSSFWCHYPYFLFSCQSKIGRKGSESRRRR